MNVQEFINAINNDKRLNITVEAVELEEGQTIEQVVAKRGLKPVGDKCKGCGVHHRYETPEGEQVFLAPSDHGEDKPMSDEEAKAEFEKRRKQALKGIRKRQARVLKMLDILKELEQSIGQDAEDRSVLDLLSEVALYAELREIAGTM